MSNLPLLSCITAKVIINPSSFSRHKSYCCFILGASLTIEKWLKDKFKPSGNDLVVIFALPKPVKVVCWVAILDHIRFDS